MREVVVFDIDGTLSNLSHRKHFVNSKPKNWPAFAKGIPFDTPHLDIIRIGEMLWTSGCELVICSGRGAEGDWEREATIKWLADQGIFHADAPEWDPATMKFSYEKLYMRTPKDYRSDDVVKSELLEQMNADGFHPWVVFDDRDQVVEMWRKRGIRCLQVAPGNF